MRSILNPILTIFLALWLCPVRALAQDGSSCANAITMDVSVGNTTINATTIGGDTRTNPNCNNSLGIPIFGSAEPKRWYTFVGNGNIITLETVDAGGGIDDTHLFAYKGTCNALVCEIANDDHDDDFATGLFSRISFTTMPGITYYIAVGAIDGFAAGIFRLEVMVTEPPSPFAGGAGTAANPYRISTIAQLNALRDYSGDDPPGINHLADTFILTRDLDFFNVDGAGTDYVYPDDAKGWLPIAHDEVIGAPGFQGTPFTGRFNGDGNVIRNLRITRGRVGDILLINIRYEELIGLFGAVDGGIIENLGVEDVDILGGRVVGALAGLLVGTIRNCYSTGTVYGTYDRDIGGLVGQNGTLEVTNPPGLILHSYSTVTVTGFRNIGGLVGLNDSYGTIRNSYATGAVMEIRRAGLGIGSGENIGGLSGFNEGVISNSYATGTVTGTNQVGGLVGQHGRLSSEGERNASITISHCYATGTMTGTGNHIGGLVGENSAFVSNSYWNTDMVTTGIGGGVDEGATGLTMAQMYVAGNFGTFGFGPTDIWHPPVNDASAATGKVFPRLRGVSKNGQVIHVPAISPKRVGDAGVTLEHSFLSPQTIPGSMTSFSSSDETVARVDASTGAVSTVGLGDVMLTVIRTGNADYGTDSVSTRLRVVPFLGAGTVEDPFQIRTNDHLNAIRGELMTEHYRLMNDLDFSGYTYDTDAFQDARGWRPIGSARVFFTGSFNGGGNVIRNLRITRTTSFIGLFGWIGRGVRIDSLGLEEVNIIGRDRVGALVGESSGTISHCYSTGKVFSKGSISSMSRAGGLVGVSEGHITHSYSTATVTSEAVILGLVQNKASIAGGLLGFARSGTVESCFATGRVSNSSEPPYLGVHVGGLMGLNQGASIRNSYATGVVSGDGNIGGLAGYNPILGTIESSYSTGKVSGLGNNVGGLVGEVLSGTVSNSYWNRETSGQETRGIGKNEAGRVTNVEGRSTAQMYMERSFEGFMFGETDAWLSPVEDASSPSGKAFPRLRGVARNAQVLDFPAIADEIAGDPSFSLSYRFISPVTIAGSATTFTSSDDDVATVDNQGQVTPIAAGEVKIAITRTEGTADAYMADAYLAVSDTATLMVTPRPPGRAMLSFGTATPTHNMVSVPIQSTELGALHYVVLGSEEAAPDDLGALRGIASALSVSIPTANMNVDLIFADLTPGTAYRVYGVLATGTEVSATATSAVYSSVVLTTLQLSISPTGMHDIGFMAGQFEVTVTANVAWTVLASGDDAAALIMSLSDGLTTDASTLNSTGDKTLTVNFTANTTMSERTTTLSFTAIGVPAVDLVIKQAPPSIAIGGVTMLPQGATAIGTPVTAITGLPAATSRFKVMVDANISWNVSSDAWVSFKKADGTESLELPVSENATVTVELAAHRLAMSRDATLTFTGTDAHASITATLRITQAGDVERFVVNGVSGTTAAAATASVGREAATLSISVDANVPWTVSETSDSDNFVTTPAPTSGTPAAVPETVMVTYMENTGITMREAVLTFSASVDGADVTVALTITQSAEDARLTIDDVTALAPSAVTVGDPVITAITGLPAEIGSFKMMMSANVSWRASSDQTWVSFKKADGTADLEDPVDEDATVTIVYAANLVVSERRATLMFTGLSGNLVVTLAITQGGGAATLSITTPTAPHDAQVIPSTAGSFEVVVSANVDWVATLPSASPVGWLTLDLNVLGGTISDSPKMMTIAYPENRMTSTRIATLTFAGTGEHSATSAMLTINQAARAMLTFGMTATATNITSTGAHVTIQSTEAGTIHYGTSDGTMPTTLMGIQGLTSPGMLSVSSSEINTEKPIMLTGLRSSTSYTVYAVLEGGSGMLLSDIASSALFTTSASSPFDGGDGTSGNPYQIRTPAQLNAIRDPVGTENYLDDHFILTAHLDFEGYGYPIPSDPVKGWTPIGHDTNPSTDDFDGAFFTGHFNGDGYVIRNLRIHREEEDFIGLFGGVNGDIDTLGLEDIDIRGKEFVGGIAGILIGTVSDSYTTGTVSGSERVGGLVGVNGESDASNTFPGVVNTSYSRALVSGDQILGGLVGLTERGSSVSRSYSTGTVSGTGNFVGAFMGLNIGAIKDCYSTGTVSGAELVGGFVGVNGQRNESAAINNSYSIGTVNGSGDFIGGFIGVNDAGSRVVNSYWNTDTSGKTIGIGTDRGMSIGTEGLLTAEMYTTASFMRWRFMDIWHAPSATSREFPILREVGGQSIVMLSFGVATDITSTGARITIRSTDMGAVHYVVLASAAAAPANLAALRELAGPLSVSIATVNTDVPIDLTNLMASTSYKVHGILATGVAPGATAVSDIASSIAFMTDGSLIESPAGVGGADIQGIRLFPNPVDDILDIEGLGSYERLALYDLNGVLVHSQEEGVRIDLRLLPAGVYTMKVRTADGIRNIRILKR